MPGNFFLFAGKSILKGFLTLVFVLFTLNSQSQFYTSGQASTSVKWMQIVTPNFQIIYPGEAYAQAQKTANVLENMYQNTSSDFHHKPRKITVLLYNRSILSNGYVVWAPRRSEWVTAPPEESYSQLWLEQLALHEYRHVVQLEKLNEGLTKILSLVFGEMATGAISAYLPLWFMEGDAEVNETSFSESGRGRQPEFHQAIRAIEFERVKRYSYDQWYLGSYKNNIPNHYYYGYQMVTYSYLKYGNEFWNQTLENVSHRPFLLTPFYLGLKKGGATSKVQLYSETFDSLKTMWSNEIYRANNFDTLSTSIKEKKFYTDYLHPHKTSRGIVAMRTSINDISRLVLITDSTEVVLHTPGYYHNTSLDARGDWVCWTESCPNIRWQQQSYSVVKLFNLRTGQSKRINRRSLISFPVLSAGTDSLALLESKPDGGYKLVVVSTQSEELLNSFDFPFDVEVRDIIWFDRQKIAYVLLGKAGIEIQTLNLTDGKCTTLYSSGFRSLSGLSVFDGNLFFSFNYDQSQNIYTLDADTRIVKRVTNSRFGASYASVSAKDSMLIYSDYSLKGYRPIQAPIKSLRLIPIDSIIPYSYSWAEALTDKRTVNLQTDTFPFQLFDTCKYRRFLHGINIHSWAPFYFNPELIAGRNTNIYPGFTILSQNKLSTVTSSLSYYYLNGLYNLEPKITYSGLFPVFEFRALVTSKPQFYNMKSHVALPENLKNAYNLSFRIYLPLNFDYSKFSQYVQPSLRLGYYNRYYYNEAFRLGYHYVEASLYAANQLKKSIRDIEPRFAQNIYLLYNLPFKPDNYFAKKYLVYGNLYFPGIFRHHNFHLFAACEEFSIYPTTLNGQIYLPHISTNQIALPRGYSYTSFYSRIERAYINYTFPLAYPEWSLGPVVYIKRLHSTFFYDIAQVNYPRRRDEYLITTTEKLESLGVELSAEINLFRFYYPIVPKLIYSYLPSEKSYNLNFSISVSSSF